MEKVRTFLKNCQRVFNITKKPTREEYEQVVKLTALGLGLIGSLGFLVQLVATALGI